MNKGILSIFLIGAALLTPCVVLSQSMEWKTYYEEEFNWSIKYPSNWTVIRDDTLSYVLFASGDGTLTIFSGNKTVPLDIWVNGSIDEWRKTFAEYTVIDKKETTFIGEKAVKVIFIGREDANSVLIKCESIFVTKSGNSYMITSITSVSDYDLVDQEYFEPMRQSFVIHNVR